MLLINYILLNNKNLLPPVGVSDKSNCGMEMVENIPQKLYYCYFEYRFSREKNWYGFAHISAKRYIYVDRLTILNVE
jgi:hypothetical protein